VCHTQADVQLVLQQLPVGMEAIYDRMASSIAQNPSITDRALASTFLQCITTSLRVLTVKELSQALHEDTSKMLDFQRSIVDLCGGFVVIDNGGNVAMIHQTAREYLLSGNDRPYYVDEASAHTEMFLNCIRCLMAVGLRAKVKGNQKPEFLDYAATSWSSHLRSIPLDSAQANVVLKKFLTGHWVLTWIQTVATGGQLGVVIQASRHLSRYFAKQNEHDAARNERDRDILKQELIESWAEDLVKIVGKFGTMLRQDPESIYRLIPPFCPRNSAIYQQFGKMKDKSLVVSGLSNENWDDSLARMSFGFGTYASFISVAGAHIVILITSGIVILYSSLTFEESTASPIKHGERIYRMELNSMGTVLATYGYKTTKIWETKTGQCSLSVGNIESRPRPLAMLLTNSSTMLVVGTDDRRIRSLNLNDTSPAWQLMAELEEPELEGHFLNSSNHMALSKDGKLIAVAYRGHPLSAWETDGPLHIGHCWRKREQIARGEVIEAAWHPHQLELLGLYIEGVVFKWRPYEGEVDEITTGASRLAISRDGNLFATGDVCGTVRVYTTSDFNLLYHSVSEDAVSSLAFSPDLRRFYDARGHYGTAWEPKALMIFAEQQGQDIRNGSEKENLAQISTVSESRTRRINSITTLAGSPTGRLYCCGTEQGTVRLHDTQREKLADFHVLKGYLSIEQISWSNDGRYFCFSDTGKRVVVKCVTFNNGNLEPTIETKAEIPVKNSISGPILQLLFHPNSSHLLVRSSSMVCIISLTSFFVTQSLDLQTADCKWITHPQDTALIIGVGPNAIDVWDWNLFKHQTYIYIHPQYQTMPVNPESFAEQTTVDRVLVTLDKKHFLVQTSLVYEKSKEKTLFYFETSSCVTSIVATPGVKPERSSMIIITFLLPRSISSQIALCLAFLSNNNLIFLSRSLSICSWRLTFRSSPSLSASLPTRGFLDVAPATTSSTPLHYHDKYDSGDSAGEKTNTLFSLPGDWISKDCVALCSVWSKERSLLCPRNGEIAVVRCAALF